MTQKAEVDGGWTTGEKLWMIENRVIGGGSGVWEGGTGIGYWK